MATDQEIRDACILYLSPQRYLKNPFTIPSFGDSQEDDNSTVGIPFTNFGQTDRGGGGGANPFGPLTPTFSSEPGDLSNFRISDLEGTSDYFPATTMFGKIKEGIGSIFKPRIRGQLGDRLLAQSRGTLAGIPTVSNILGKFRSPFNPNSPTFNAALPSQLNFLEAGTGTRVTGTSDNLKFTDGLNLIGRDPNTGGLKYGPGSVLAGKNVISGFGTNDYETALNDYISKMINRGVLSKFQQAKLDQARKELDDLLANQKEEFDKPGGTGDQVAEIQGRIDQKENDINIEASNNESPTGASLVNPNSAFGKSQGYTGGSPNPHTPTGWSGSSKGGNGGGGGNPTGSPGSKGPGGSDEMGSFRRGGLAGILGF